jgi:hypothetical protein
VNADAEQRIGVSGLQVPNLELLNHLTPHLLVVPDSDGGILSGRSDYYGSVLTNVHLSDWSRMEPVVNKLELHF